MKMQAKIVIWSFAIAATLSALAIMIYRSELNARICMELDRQLTDEEMLKYAFTHVFKDADIDDVEIEPERKYKSGTFASVTDGKHELILDTNVRWGGIFGEATPDVSVGYAYIYFTGASWLVMDACGQLSDGAELWQIREK